MARTDGRPEKQHYVPKVLLRAFGSEGGRKERQVYVFDKRDDHVFKASVENVCAERLYNEGTFPDGNEIGFEEILSQLEAHAGAALQKVRTARHLRILEPTDGWWIAQFVAWQFMRTPNQRNLVQSISDQLARKIVAMGSDPNQVQGWKPIVGKEELKATHLAVMLNARLLAERLHEKTWSLWETPAARPFWLSDNPVALHNDRDFGPYGSLGFNVPGIQIYLPIAPTLAIGFWCPTREAEFVAVRRQHEELRALWRMTPEYRSDVDEVILRRLGGGDSARVETMHDALVEGAPVECSERDWMLLNSLQVHWAERYLFAHSESFDFARRILREKPEKRQGPRLKF